MNKELNEENSKQLSRFANPHVQVNLTKLPDTNKIPDGTFLHITEGNIDHIYIVVSGKKIKLI